MGKLVSIIETARRFGLTEQTIRNWIDNGLINVKKVGKARYIDESTINALQDTAIDIKAQQEALGKLRDAISAEYQELRLNREEDKTRRRYTNLMVGSAFRNEFFGTMVRLMHIYGSLNAREAHVLTEYLNGTTLETIGSVFGLTRERIRQIVAKAIHKSSDLTEIESKLDELKTLQVENKTLRFTIDGLKKKLLKYETPKEEKPINKDLCELLATKIIDCNFTVRALNCFCSADIETIGELVRYDKLDLLRMRNFGKKTITEIEDFFSDHGLSWGMDIDNIYTNSKL